MLWVKCNESSVGTGPLSIVVKCSVSGQLDRATLKRSSDGSNIDNEVVLEEMSKASSRAKVDAPTYNILAFLGRF